VHAVNDQQQRSRLLWFTAPSSSSSTTTTTTSSSAKLNDVPNGNDANVRSQRYADELQRPNGHDLLPDGFNVSHDDDGSTHVLRNGPYGINDGPNTHVSDGNDADACDERYADDL